MINTTDVMEESNFENAMRCIEQLKEYGLVTGDANDALVDAPEKRKMKAKEKEKRKKQRKDKEKDKANMPNKLINTQYDNKQYANRLNRQYDKYANKSYITRGGNVENQKVKTKIAQAVPPENEWRGEKGRNCPPFAAGEEPDRNRMIPLKELPESCRHVVMVWNRLKLKTFYGLYPSLVEKVEALLLQYEEDEVLQGIANVGDSSFLLGLKKHSRFKATLGWVLDPHHFANVLAGKYRDEFDEYDEWNDGAPLPDSLTGVSEGWEMTREERRQAVKELWYPQTPEKEEAARLLGLA